MASLPFDPRNPQLTTPALRHLLGRAVMLTSQSDEAPQKVSASFTTILAAFLVDDAPLSRWFQTFVNQANISIAAIRDAKTISADWFEATRAESDPDKYLERMKELTVSSVNILREANELRDTISNENGRADIYSQRSSSSISAEPLDIRHLMGAFIYRPGIAHENSLRQFGFNPPDWSNSFLGALASIYSQYPDEIRAWQEIHTQQFGSPPRSPATLGLAGYSADLATGTETDDLLNITPEVKALGTLITAKTTTPPLAIGVFGEWGSGKTFFMRNLIQYIDELTASARNSKQLQKDITLYKRVVQIEFNAWHYVGGNLWPSLVEHIFTNLRLSQDPKWSPDGVDPDILREHLLQQLDSEKSRRDAALEQAEEAKEKFNDAVKERRRLERQRDEKLRELADVKAGDVLKSIDLTPVMGGIKQALTDAGFPDVVQQIDEVNKALSEARLVMQQGTSIFRPIIYAEDSDKRIQLLLLALLAGPVVGLIGAFVGVWLAEPNVQQSVAQVAGITSGVAGLIGSVVGWLSRQAKWSSARLNEIIGAERKLQVLQTRKLTEHEQQIEQLQQEADRFHQQYLEKLEEENEARQEIERIVGQIEKLAPAPVLADFIQGRTESEDYRKHLGILALIRRDFETLNKYIKRVNDFLEGFEGDLEKENHDVLRHINRIVLYIDDLDRCPPENVVEVLEAVHLLMAFPLFVVVVGVDARWISHSLEKEYPHLLSDEETAKLAADNVQDATPHDYLEKIFQVPIWLKAMGEDGSKQMLDGLLKNNIATDEQAGEADRGSSEDQQANSQPVSEDQDLDDTHDAEPILGQEGEESAVPPPINLKPESLMISKKELEFMKEIAFVLGRSPRAIKRFVNTYRLIKVVLSLGQTPLSLDEGPDKVADYQVVIFLLAVITGLPKISGRFFAELGSGQHQNLLAVVEALDALPRGRREKERLTGWLAEYCEGDWQAMSMNQFRKRVPEIVRYSFRVFQSSEAASADE